MRCLLLALAFSIALPVAACEKCTMWFDSQAMTWCKDCVYSYCGYYSCSVETDASGFQYCGSAWDADGDDRCFTNEGVAKNWCGPDEKDPIAALKAPSEWQLVRARVLPRTPRVTQLAERMDP